MIVSKFKTISGHRYIYMSSIILEGSKKGQKD